jgi:ankyrin repeat protein
VDEICGAIQANDLETVKALISQDSTLANTKTPEGSTPLHFAAKFGHPFVIHHLVSCNADLNCLDAEGMSPLMLATKSCQLMAMQALCELHVDVNLCNPGGASALHYASAAGDVKILEALVQNKANPVCEGGASPLHWAMKAGDVAPAAFLLDECKVPLDVTDDANCTALHVAAADGNADLALFLLERGSNPNAKSKTGATPLHLAAQHERMEIIKHLLTFGAELSADDAGATPMQIAEQQQKKDIIKELQKKVSGGYDLTEKKRTEDMDRFKAQGNKVFQAGEYSKSSKFYTKAISYCPKNHVLYSNRSASYYNLRRLYAALADATHCIALKPDWPKGYFRKAATLVLLEKYTDAKTVFEAGLKLDPKNADLKNGMRDLDKLMSKKS